MKTLMMTVLVLMSMMFGVAQAADLCVNADGTVNDPAMQTNGPVDMFQLVL